MFFLKFLLIYIGVFSSILQDTWLARFFYPITFFLLLICMFYSPWECTHTEERIDTLILLGKISLLSFSPNQAWVVFVDLLHQTNQSIVV